MEQKSKDTMEIEKDKEGPKVEEGFANIEEDDDDFEDFEVDDWEGNEENKIDIKQWQEDWDDEDVEDEFTNQLRKELNL